MKSISHAFRVGSRFGTEIAAWGTRLKNIVFLSVLKTLVKENINPIDKILKTNQEKI